ncbi:hypothetical protein AAFF_G00378330 [Aldrovandia affinis]|uniref:Uncharacterized protein n=1 Tax=Aldrovandia affinis TaxID=143900 RepID=A0AAD7R4L0_9TELE|nr:hypothetical protein AAFF_G00378330 [Aldrovandia affinis]
MDKGAAEEEEIVEDKEVVAEPDREEGATIKVTNSNNNSSSMDREQPPAVTGHATPAGRQDTSQGTALRIRKISKVGANADSGTSTTREEPGEERHPKE